MIENLVIALLTILFVCTGFFAIFSVATLVVEYLGHDE